MFGGRLFTTNYCISRPQKIIEETPDSVKMLRICYGTRAKKRSETRIIEAPQNPGLNQPGGNCDTSLELKRPG